MRTAYILRGVSGSGKSFYASALRAQQRCTIVSADKFFMEEGLIETVSPVPGAVPFRKPGIVYNLDLSKLPEAHASCMLMFLMALRNDVPTIVVDNTNTRLWEFASYTEAAALANYSVRVVEFPVTTLEQIYRCARRSQHINDPLIVAKQALNWEVYPAYETKEV